MSDQQQQTLAIVHPATIAMGPIPFNLYASERGQKIVLFCKVGFPITERHKKLLERTDRLFYVGSAEMGAYHDYALQRFADISESSAVPEDDKASLIRSIGKRIVHSLYSEPRSKEAMRTSGTFVEKHLDLILRSNVAVQNLFSSSKNSSFALTHSINVSTFCLLIGKRLYGEDREALMKLGLGGLLLDIGMTIIDRAALESSGPLKKSHRNVLRTHPQKTEELLLGHGLPKEVMLMGLQHHERGDGSGYPAGLKLTDIHPFARIAAVADVYDAMTSEREHRPARSHSAALAEMCLNKQMFDHKVLEILLRLVLRDERLVRTFISGGSELKTLLR